MPRKKKDGRFINYYIDRQIYERLEQYADDKGQSMTTAIERILKEYLDRYESTSQHEGGNMMYCPNCNLLVSGTRCPVCGSRQLSAPQPEDYCYLVEKEAIWSEALSDLLTQNQIPFLTKNVLGAGLAAKMGSGAEKVRFYVPYAHYENAHALEQEFFSAEAVAAELDQQTEE